MIGDSRSVERMFSRTSASAQGFGSSLASVAGKVAKSAAIITGAAALGGIAVTLKQGTEEWMQHAKVAAQTSAALASTGSVANVTKGHIEALAQAQMLKTGVDDELIQSGENLLLTFKNVRNELGEGNKVFDRATVAALDLSQAGFGSIESASKMLGKALNDPIKGMTAMSRAGVTFSESQKKAIEALVKSGELLSAQKLILKEVESQVGGSAAAYGKTLPGQIKILRESFNNLAGDIVGALMPSLSKGVSAAAGFVGELSKAKGWRAKLNIVWTGMHDAGRTITDKVGDAIAAVDWKAAWAKAKGIGAGLADRLESIDWTKVGAGIGDGISGAVSLAISGSKGLPTAFLKAFDSIDWNKLGRAAGPGLAAAIVAAFVALTDPGFWVKNWDLALSIALVAFSGPIGKLAGKLLGPLKKLGGNMVLSIVGGLEEVAPKLASALFAGLLKLPALVSRALGFLVAPVAGVFAWLGRLAQFTVKVLGIKIAIDAIVGFAKQVPGYFSDAAHWLYDAGRKILEGLLNGLKSKWEDIKGFVGGIGPWIKEHKGPLAADAALLKPAGIAIMRGLYEGLKSGMPAIEASLRDLTARMAAINERRAAEDRAAAVRDAVAALAEAKKKGEGILAAERALARAREDIVVAGLTKQLAKEQAFYDKRQAMIQAKMDRLHAIAQKAQDKAGAIFDRLGGKIAAAFDAVSGAFVTPAGQEKAAIALRRQQEDLALAVEAAQARVTEAMKGDDPAAVVEAQRALARAIEDVHVASLDKQEAEQQSAWDRMRESMREKLDGRLELLRKKLTEEGSTWGSAMKAIESLLSGYDLSFATIGATLGSAFLEALKAAASGTAEASVAVKTAVSNSRAAAKVARTPHGLESLDSGGTVLTTGLAKVHRGETFSGADGTYGAQASRPGSGDTFVFEIGGKELVRYTYRELLREQGRNVNLGIIGA